MPRLFTGLEAPEETSMRLSLLRGGLCGARWIEPSDYHVTLSFIGDVDHGVARAVEEELAEIDCPAQKLRITSLAAFGGDRPRAIVASLELTPQLSVLQGESDKALRRAGVAPERRKYAPHITLARLSGVSSGAAAALLGERYLPPVEFTARRFVLYSARTSRGGGPYAIEAAYPLR